MGFFTKDIKTMDDLFLHGLKDLYYAENQIAKSLPDMIEKATKPELKTAFERHLTETEGQIERLRRVFELLGVDPKGEKCPAIEGILKEGKELMGEIDDADVMNVGLVAAAQAVEHYEITRYGALIAWAGELGRSDCIPLFQANLEEEKATDAKLTRMAEKRFSPPVTGKTETNLAKKPVKKSKSTARRPTKAARSAKSASRPAPRKKQARKAARRRS